VSHIAIAAEGLAKRYRLGQTVGRYPTLRDALASAAAGAMRAPAALLRRRSADPVAGFDALRDVSFEIPAGQVVGIIGRNGAGKSTLLKILSRITAPTEGHAIVRGRVGSLLEVGTGFHPELTGRENVFLNGAILGMRRAEIARKFDEIIAFAEVERFVDTPVKFYSSGMHLRLAFAVAAHLEPEVLFVDEVLAVGDAAFQRKCLGKIGDVARSGRTVLFTSHNLVAVESLCDRVLWLREGRVAGDGPARQIVARYLDDALETALDVTWPDPAAAPGTSDLRLHRVAVRPVADGRSDPALTIRTPIEVEIEYWNHDPTAVLVPFLALYDRHDILVFDVGPPVDPAGARPSPAGLLRARCTIPGDLLNDGIYRAVVSVNRNGRPAIERETALVFAVQDSEEQRFGWYGEWPGVLRPSFPWRIESLSADPVQPGPDRDAALAAAGPSCSRGTAAPLPPPG
jgi:lipopolysaccharide transport system ATP-binding protein